MYGKAYEIIRFMTVLSKFLFKGGSYYENFVALFKNTNNSFELYLFSKKWESN